MQFYTFDWTEKWGSLHIPVKPRVGNSVSNLKKKKAKKKKMTVS
jgi:hypothetical protein